MIAASLRRSRIFRCGRDGRSIRNSFAHRVITRLRAHAACRRLRRQRSLGDPAACRHDLHHPRRQRRAGLSLANPAGALDGRLGLRRLCLCLDLGAAARQHDGFRHLGIGAKNHSGISHQRRARAAARLSLRQPLDDFCRLVAGLGAAGGRRQTAVAVDRRQRRSFRSISAASRCRPSWSPTPRTASRARTTGCGSG